MNERIRAREVRLIDENGAQLGILPTREALRIARERELDLIEVAPNAQPPVCRIMDYGKHKYQQARREREQHKRSKATEVRLIRLKPQIGPHDLEIKVRKLRELLGDGNKVRIQLRFRGREISHPELGTQLLRRIGEELTEVSVVEGPPRFEGRMMNMLLAPKPGAKPAAPAQPKTASAEKPAPAELAPAATAAPPQESAPSAAAVHETPAAARPEAVAPTAASAAQPATMGPAGPARAVTTGPAGPSKAGTDGKEQGQQGQVQRPAQNEDAEDSGEAG